MGIFLSCSANAEDAGGKKELTYEILEKLNQKGKCEDYQGVLSKSRRRASLLFMEDTLFGVLGKDSYTKDVVGDIRAFGIGRDVDETLLNLYEYSSRHDVRKQIERDATAIAAESKKINSAIKDSSSSTEELVVPLVCNMYDMLSGRDYYFKEELQKYFNGLNREIMHKNLNRLHDLTKDL